MEKIKAIVVDDESEARDLIASLLSDSGEVEVLDKAESADGAFQSVVEHNPDMIFLDIDMPEKNGFELLKRLKNSRYSPTIIFVTAYNQFAIEAIKHAAFDYLLKPVDIDELKLSIERYKDEMKSQASLGRIENLLQALQQEKLKFTSRTGTIYINPADIIYCHADGNYTDLFLTGKKKQTVTMNIGRLEAALPYNHFKKISRSVIINTNYLAEISRKDKVCRLKVNEECIDLPIPPKYISLLQME